MVEICIIMARELFRRKKLVMDGIEKMPYLREFSKYIIAIGKI